MASVASGASVASIDGQGEGRGGASTSRWGRDGAAEVGRRGCGTTEKVKRIWAAAWLTTAWFEGRQQGRARRAEE